MYCISYSKCLDTFVEDFHYRDISLMGKRAVLQLLNVCEEEVFARANAFIDPAQKIWLQQLVGEADDMLSQIAALEEHPPKEELIIHARYILISYAMGLGYFFVSARLHPIELQGIFTGARDIARVFADRIANCTADSVEMKEIASQIVSLRSAGSPFMDNTQAFRDFQGMMIDRLIPNFNELGFWEQAHTPWASHFRVLVLCMTDMLCSTETAFPWEKHDISEMW